MSIDSFKFMPRSLAQSMKLWRYVDTSDEEIPWTPTRKKIEDCKVALISSGGFYHKDDKPFDLDRERREPLWGDPTFRKIPRGISQEDIRMGHLHYENSHAQKDFNCMFPIKALEDLLADGLIGGTADYQLSFMGYQPRIGTFIRETAPRTIELLSEMDVDLVLLSPG